MSNIPEGAKVPQDRKVGKVQQFEEGLAQLGIPVGTVPLGFRPRQRNEVMELAFRLRDLVKPDDGADEVEVDLDSLSDEQTKELLDVIADFDDLVAANALDPGEYVTWSRLAGYEDFSSLLTLYAGVLGESTSSTN
jgi:hypothetical protein